MDIDAYLDRIGATRPAVPDADALRDLQARHLTAVPFENLSIHLGEPLSLAPADLLDKIVRRRRGGFCYELNGAFAELLAALGFQVSMLGARVYDYDNDRYGPPLDHLALRVDLAEPWLVDVGFGRFARHPLRLTATEPQADPHGEFLVLDTPEGDLEIRRDGTPAYRLEPKVRQLDEFTAMCWFQQHSPESPFTQQVTCSLATGDGRVTLAGDKLIETGGDRRTERVLSDEEILSTYRERFGIDLDRVPVVGQGRTT